MHVMYHVVNVRSCASIQCLLHKHIITHPINVSHSLSPYTKHIIGAIGQRDDPYGDAAHHRPLVQHLGGAARSSCARVGGPGWLLECPHIVVEEGQLAMCRNHALGAWCSYRGCLLVLHLSRNNCLTFTTLYLACMP